MDVAKSWLGTAIREWRGVFMPCDNLLFGAMRRAFGMQDTACRVFAKRFPAAKSPAHCASVVRKAGNHMTTPFDRPLSLAIDAIHDELDKIAHLRGPRYACRRIWLRFRLRQLERRIPS